MDIPNDDVSVLPNVFLRSGFGNIAVRVQAMVEPSSGNPHFIVATEFNYQESCMFSERSNCDIR